MKSFMFIFILIAFASAFALQQHFETQVVVPNSVLGNGGDMISGNNYRITGTLGQPLIGVSKNPSNLNSVGFWYQATHTVITSLDQTSSSVPKEYRLKQNYPNPFNPTTTIEFALPQQSAVTLKLFDILGREVTTLMDEELEPGVHKVDFDAKDLASGVYFYQIHAEAFSSGSGQGFVRTKKLMLLK